MSSVIDGMTCMDFGGNFVLRHSQVIKNFQMRNWDVRVNNFSCDLTAQNLQFLGDTPIHHEDNDMNHFVVVVGIPYDFLAHLVSLKQISMNWSAQNVYSLGDISSHH